MLCCVTLSRVITLYKQYHTHPGPSLPHKGQTKTAPHDDERQMKVIKTYYITCFLLFANRQFIEKSGKVLTPNVLLCCIHRTYQSGFIKSEIQNLHHSLSKI